VRWAALRDGARPTALRGEAPIAHNILFPRANGQRLRYRDEDPPPDPSLRARCDDPQSALELLEGLLAPWALPPAAPASNNRAQGESADPAARLAVASARQRVALVEAAAAQLAALPADERAARLAGWQRRLDAHPPSLLHWTLWQCLGAATRDRSTAAAHAQPCCIADRPFEVRQLLGWMLVRSGAAGAPALALLQQHEAALGLPPSAQLVAPAADAYASAAARLRGLDGGQQTLLLRALHALARHDRRLRDEEWLLLRGLAAAWGLPAGDALPA
jgi:hypothetical protein